MISTTLNNKIPISSIGPAWPGVHVALTETGFQAGGLALASYGYNLGAHVGDSLTQVQARREELQAYLGAPIEWLNQIHGCDVHYAHPPASKTIANADASVSTRSDVALAIMTADCLPVLFAAFDNSGHVKGVAAAHAGWRGLHAGVLQATATALSSSCELPASQIKAWMGPAIGPLSFEVGQEVRDAFTTQNAENARCFVPGSGTGKYLANIYALAGAALTSAGVTQLDGGGFDTLTDLRWFSHRRGQQQGVQSGRFATLIRLLPSQGV